MAHLYEINAEIERMQNRIEWEPDANAYVDYDTGEILSDEELDAMFAELKMDKHEILVWMAKCVLNDRSEAESIRAEEKRLAERRKRFEKRAERFERIIDRECAGENTDLGVATMKYTTSHPLEFKEEQEQAIIKWLEEKGYKECVKVTKEIRKTETKNLINKKGIMVPGCTVADKKNPSLK